MKKITSIFILLLLTSRIGYSDQLAKFIIATNENGESVLQLNERVLTEKMREKILKLFSESTTEQVIWVVVNPEVRAEDLLIFLQELKTAGFKNIEVLLKNKPDGDPLEPSKDIVLKFVHESLTYSVMQNGLEPRTK